MQTKLRATRAPIASAVCPEGKTGPASIHAALQNFDLLPDSAGARVPVVAALFSVSEPTVWRWTRDGQLPAPTKRGGVTLWNVGALRRCMAGDVAAGGLQPAGSQTGLRTTRATAAASAKRTTAPAT